MQDGWRINTWDIIVPDHLSQILQYEFALRIKMTLIELKDLETTLAASPNQKHAVYITMQDCSDCSTNENTLNNAFSTISDIKWYKIHVTEETPFFAPTTIPSVVFFEGRNRVVEGIGIMDSSNIDAFVQFVKSFLGLTEGEKWLSSTVE